MGMRQIIVSEFLSLDGVMQGPGDPNEDREGGFDKGGWQMPYNDEEQMRTVGERIGSTDAYLLGRKTYDIFARYWPNQPDSDPFAATLNGKPKYVVSRTLREPLTWRNSHLIAGDVAAEVRKVKEQDGKNITILGSGELVRTLADEGLIDEYWLMICPLVLGSGKRLFRDGFNFGHLQLRDSQTNSKGALLLTYRPTDEPPSA
jgi:dihydrofolate reductase